MWSPGKSQNEYTPQVFLADPAALDRPDLPAEAVARFVKRADEALSQPPPSVVQKSRPAPSGNPHDYVSLRTYSTDGVIDPDVTLYDRLSLNAMAEAVDTLAVAWRITAQRRYAEKAAEFLRVWFLDPASRMNPHLEYGQIRPGGDRGRSTGIIDTHSLILVPQAVELLTGASVLSPDELAALVQWFADYLGWLVTSDLGLGEADRPNNHGTWYRVQVASYARFTGRLDLARAVCGLSGSLLAGQVADDGAQPQEHRRTRGLFYSLFNVQGWCMLSMIARQVGVATWAPHSPAGKRVQAAMDHLLPYLAGQPWPHQQIDEMDHRRSAAMLCLASWWWQDVRYVAAIKQLPADVQDTPGRLLYQVAR